MIHIKKDQFDDKQIDILLNMINEEIGSSEQLNIRMTMFIVKILHRYNQSFNIDNFFNRVFIRNSARNYYIQNRDYLMALYRNKDYEDKDYEDGEDYEDEDYEVYEDEDEEDDEDYDAGA